MPLAVTHILFPIILFSVIRDFYLRKRERKSFPLHYVLLAGLGGTLPDIDIPISFILNFLGIASWELHRTFTHLFIFPAIFFILFLVFSRINARARICNLTRHNLKLSTIFLMISIGTLIHILLDNSFIYFVDIFPQETRPWIPATLDGILLIIWIVYLELKHKISDFI
ncbi:metal-dependent hydrolase [Candidatus Pacearchaeota archaeon]|nr:metal-dependent hydrolase [Candidatus Pacearchaeota archaeon]